MAMVAFDGNAQQLCADAAIGLENQDARWGVGRCRHNPGQANKGPRRPQ
jgi:hypothetical protein